MLAWGPLPCVSSICRRTKPHHGAHGSPKWGKHGTTEKRYRTIRPLHVSNIQVRQKQNALEFLSISTPVGSPKRPLRPNRSGETYRNHRLPTIVILSHLCSWRRKTTPFPSWGRSLCVHIDQDSSPLWPWKDFRISALTDGPGGGYAGRWESTTSRGRDRRNTLTDPSVASSASPWWIVEFWSSVHHRSSYLHSIFHQLHHLISYSNRFPPWYRGLLSCSISA